MADGEKRFQNLGTLKPGSYVLVDGEPCQVKAIDKSKPGKHGHSKVRISAVGLVDDRKKIVVMPGHDNVEVPIIEKRNAQVLSVHGDAANVMDSETYETFDLKIPEEFKGQVTEGSSVLYWTIMDEKVIKQVKGAD